MKNWRHFLLVVVVAVNAATAAPSLDDTTLRSGIDGSSADNPPPVGPVRPVEAPSPEVFEGSSSRIRHIWPHVTILVISVGVLIFVLGRELGARRRKQRRRKRRAL